MKLKKLGLAIAAISVVTACGGGSDGPTVQAPAFDLETAKEVIKTNADIASAVYTDSLLTAQALETAITAFNAAAADPATTADVDALFVAAKEAWLVAREPYGQTEVYRFRNGPIDREGVAGKADGPEGALNAWPLGEALIDAVIAGGDSSDFTPDTLGVTASETPVNDGGEVTGTENPAINIIAADSFAINEALLEGGFADGADERDVLSGYHAIEFLLWGQDTATDSNNNNAAIVTNPNDATGDSSRTNAVQTGANGGTRLVTAFTTDDNAARRRDYLAVAAAKLVKDLQTVADEWDASKADNHYAEFTAVTTITEAKDRLGKILQGMGTLSQGELGGERMQIAFSANSQEDEHSCFSDNTHRDIALNAEGVSNSYTGTYNGYDADLDGTIAGDNIGNAVDGKGIDALLEASGQKALADQLTAAFSDTEIAYGQIDTDAREGTPFDVQILVADNNEPVADTILALTAQANLIAKVAEEFGITLGEDFKDGTGCDTNNPTSACPE